MSAEREALLWCLDHFEALDRANACIHCAPVRYSPLTFRIADALAEDWTPGDEMPAAMKRVRGHRGAYDVDPGR